MHPRPPEPTLPAVDRDDQLVQMPFVGYPWPASPDAILEVAAHAVNPLSDGFPADRHTAFSEQIFNIGGAKRKAMISPDCIGDDLARETKTLQTRYLGRYSPTGPRNALSASQGSISHGISMTSSRISRFTYWPPTNGSKTKTRSFRGGIAAYDKRGNPDHFLERTIQVSSILTSCNPGLSSTMKLAASGSPAGDCAMASILAKPGARSSTEKFLRCEA